MSIPLRYVSLLLAIVISLHYILSFTNNEYSQVTSLSSLSNITSHFRFPIPEDFTSPFSHQNSSQLTAEPRVNATFVVLARNSNLEGTVQSVRELEDRFNRNYNYPYVFLNEEPFSEEFQRRISVLTNAKVEFGVIPQDHWYQPDWIDEDRATESRNQMVEHNVIYGGSVSYRNMCRFNSGFFFKHELLQKYRWYWRIEPDIHFHCDINFDPFAFMQEQNKTYGFTLSMFEYLETIPTLWGHVQDFIRENPHHVPQDNAMGFLTDDGGQTYNSCHFWSNFEIADMDFWRGPAYTAFFEYLDSQGGFYYERWGDAPVHSLAAAAFLRKDQIHFFDEIGYFHNPFTHCPQGDKWTQGRCSCNPDSNFDYIDAIATVVTTTWIWSLYGGPASHKKL